jgi:tRNA-specific 2-thiouridylase
MKKRVVVAMSGGVDSASAACLLLKQGYDVIGISLKFFNAEEAQESTKTASGCCGVQGIEDARAVAQRLSIPFYALNFQDIFEREVINYFCREYENGRTPNPCIMCNEKIKFGILLEKAKGLQARFVATGHYARVQPDRQNGRFLLKKGKDKEKDQSYFLFSLSQDVLKWALFPLGNYTKSQARKIAKRFGLKVHDKPASQEICFVKDFDYKKFLIARNPDLKKPGPIVDVCGRILGRHRGIAFYTVGQREGLGVSYKRPLYVLAIDKDRNRIIVGQAEQTYSKGLIAACVNWISQDDIDKIKAKAKIRYNHEPCDALITRIGKRRARVEFARPQRSIAPGQAVVFYLGDTVIGGGIIEKSI